MKERRESLLEAAVTCFAKKGFHGTRVSDIVAEAGVAQGTFYWYFKSKEEIFSELIDHFLNRINQSFSVAHWEDVRTLDQLKDALITMVENMFNISWENKEVFSIFLKVGPSVGQEFEEKLNEFLNLAVETSKSIVRMIPNDNLIRSDLDVVCDAIVGMYFYVIQRRILQAKEKPDIKKLACEMVEMELYGISGHL
ncbi:TetR/AcrR family transcriptional regulator [Microaerobacter geothermalis]|uniref:TetR/AcrR family transcriptional regulator n=1 Tax=Microaerobacter geothermalis TaxID=674972 RepID=UPI001F3B7EC5|nr:TetR/AcrR family transcriptional regulator [Microaerobacter geothermalis]MCF6094280.1 TetR/AcrR family transcriptional regulator [Microaerobacter geothermalis]